MTTRLSFARRLGRREALSVLGTAVVGGAALAVGSATPANAAAGANLVLGQGNSAGSSETSLTASAPGPTLAVMSSGTGAALSGDDSGTGTGAGVIGQIANPTNNEPAVYGITAGTGPAVSGYVGNSASATPAVSGVNIGNAEGVRGSDGSVGFGAGVSGFVGNPKNANAGVNGTTNGTGSGVSGTGAVGVLGTGTGIGGIGVRAVAPTGGVGLDVDGPSTFSNSGVATVPIGASTVTIDNVPLTATSFVLATLQSGIGRTWVASAVPNATTGTVIVTLNRVTKKVVKVGWFAIN